MTQDTPEDAPKTLGEMNHTNPFTGEAFGATQTYDRGRTIAADGGEDPEREAEVADERDAEAATDGGEAGGRTSSEQGSDGGESDDAPEAEELRDVDHEPPGDSEGANGVYERGNEGREENR